jgi:hypothetical protein
VAVSDPIVTALTAPRDKPRESEYDFAVRLAHGVHDKADRFGAIDPDGDLAVLVRQFLRVQGLI